MFVQRSVRIIGWLTIVASILLILSGLGGLIFGESTDEIDSLLKLIPQAQAETMKSLTDTMQYARAWSIYTIFYFASVLVGAVQFVRFRRLGRTMLEVLCWVGMMNACIDSVISYVMMNAMSQSMSRVVGAAGMNLDNLNPLGNIALIVGFILWVVPAAGLIVYLRRPDVKALMI
jgi:hypothetical protein